MRKVWIGTSHKENIGIAIHEGVWGNKKNKRMFKEGKRGDILILSTGSKKPKNGLIAVCELMGSSFISNENPWGDGNYSNMIPIKCIKINQGDLPYKEMNKSIIKKGHAVYNLSTPINFSQMEQFFKFLKIEFEEVKEVEVKKVEKKNTNSSGFVYAMMNKRDQDKVKVGFTTQSEVEKRRKQLQTGSPDDLQIIFEKSVNNPKQVEKKIHNILDIFNCRYNREWFVIDKPMIRKLITEITEIM